jgi:hypothetical protein
VPSADLLSNETVTSRIFARYRWREIAHSLTLDAVRDLRSECPTADGALISYNE